jgi:hypothetical protein
MHPQEIVMSNEIALVDGRKTTMKLACKKLSCLRHRKMTEELSRRCVYNKAWNSYIY